MGLSNVCFIDISESKKGKLEIHEPCENGIVSFNILDYGFIYIKMINYSVVAFSPFESHLFLETINKILFGFVCPLETVHMFLSLA